MQDILIYKQKDLVLKVNNNFDPTKLRLDDWIPFIERLCGNREYQKAAIKSSIIYLASGRYKSIEDLFEENFQKNNELQSKYTSLANFKSMIQIPNKLFANIDLATGTGKSYVIYGVAQIMLGLGLIDKVLVLCPSLTMEIHSIPKSEFIEKYILEPVLLNEQLVYELLDVYPNHFKLFRKRLKEGYCDGLIRKEE